MNFYCQYTKLIFLYFWQHAKILETNNASISFLEIICILFHLTIECYASDASFSPGKVRVCLNCVQKRIFNKNVGV